MLHQAVYRAFPDKADDGTGRVLYRIDRDHHSKVVSLLVQSEKMPDWAKAGHLNECLLDAVESKPFALSVVEGQRLLFRLRANPSVKKQAEGKRNGYRMGLRREEDQLKWLQHKAGESGFAVISCKTLPEGIIRDRREPSEKGNLRHYAVRFDGMLKVLNTDTFTAALESGIGPAKGFGFGLLSVAPVREA
jgi:CRISPR system Cascade subunit CasE